MFMNKYYVYAHSNDKFGVFYVGKGSGKRLFTTGNRSEFWKRIVKKYGYVAQIIEETETEEQAFEREVFWIDYYKKQKQCVANFTNGGDGVRVSHRWWNNKISKALSGVKRGSGLMSKSFVNFADRETLYRLYIAESKSTIEIGKLFGISATTVYERLKFYQIEPRKVGSHRRAVVCVTTNQEFNSVKEAAQTLGVYRENINKVLNGKYKSTGGYFFKYKEQQ